MKSNNQDKSSLVSIITPVFNAERYVAACVESVLAQTYGNFEQILVDDRSTDRSVAIIEAYAARDSRIRYVQLPENSGPGIARNKAIEMAKGRYIAFLDCDDLWKPNKLENQIGFMEQMGHAFTFTAYEVMDEAGNALNRTVGVPEKVTYRSALYKNPVGCLTAIYDSAFFGKQYMPPIRKRQDYALWLKLLKKTDGYGMQQPLALYRIQKNSVSSNKIGLIKYEWRIYREVEGLGLLQSTFYLVSAIFLKLKSYF